MWNKAPEAPSSRACKNLMNRVVVEVIVLLKQRKLANKNDHISYPCKVNMFIQQPSFFFYQAVMQTNGKECIVFHFHATAMQNIRVNFISAYVFNTAQCLWGRGEEKSRVWGWWWGGGWFEGNQSLLQFSFSVSLCEDTSTLGSYDDLRLAVLHSCKIIKKGKSQVWLK